MRVNSLTFQNTFRADFHHPYFGTPVSCLKRPKGSRAHRVSKNMRLLLIQVYSKTDIWGLPLCVIQPLNRLHLLCWQEDITFQMKSHLVIRTECADVPFWSSVLSSCRPCLNARQLQNCWPRPPGFVITSALVFSSNILKIEGVLDQNTNEKIVPPTKTSLYDLELHSNRRISKQ